MTFISAPLANPAHEKRLTVLSTSIEKDDRLFMKLRYAQKITGDIGASVK
jgi:hypothetical protein